MLLLNIITIGLDTNYNNLQGSSPLFLWQGASKFLAHDCVPIDIQTTELFIDFDKFINKSRYSDLFIITHDTWGY
jgi:hypothetical protein